MFFLPGRGGARLAGPRVVVQAEGVVGGGGELHVELLHGRHGGAHHVPRPVEVVRVVESELGGGGGSALHTTKVKIQMHTDTYSQVSSYPGVGVGVAGGRAHAAPVPVAGAPAAAALGEHLSSLQPRGALGSDV